MIETSRIKPELQATAGQWVYLQCQCMVPNYTGRGVIAEFTYECSACGNTNLRFIHTLEHEETKQLIEVGIECARALLDPLIGRSHRLAENEVKRKERWRIHYGRPGRCYVTVDELIEKGKL